MWDVLSSSLTSNNQYVLSNSSWTISWAASINEKSQLLFLKNSSLRWGWRTRCMMCDVLQSEHITFKDKNKRTVLLWTAPRDYIPNQSLAAPAAYPVRGVLYLKWHVCALQGCFGEYSENIPCHHMSPLQSLLVPCLRSPSSDGETTVPSLLMEWQADEWEPLSMWESCHKGWIPCSMLGHFTWKNAEAVVYLVNYYLYIT